MILILWQVFHLSAASIGGIIVMERKWRCQRVNLGTYYSTRLLPLNTRTVTYIGRSLRDQFFLPIRQSVAYHEVHRLI